MPATDFEKLGAFYLGNLYDAAARARTGQPLLYDSRDLVTHAVCVGMTGSGKTGLCISLLEEAAIDGVPAIVVDPKGDLTNLLLTFPELRAEDFRPWINEEEARRRAMDPGTYAADQAALWKNGLAQWSQDGERIARLRSAADFAIYTPGSSAGLGVSVLRSFDAPPPEVIDDAEVFGERVSSTATSLLGLLAVEGDPLRSREHALLSTILSAAWRQGRALELADLVREIQTPSIERIGVVDLETFFPAKDRFELAMRLNTLIASPGFARWLEGEPLDIGAMLFTPAGRPRVSIFSIAHLPDAERMFFVSMLLNQMLAWVRMQTGTSSLRALLYMDEIAGYFPPVANPPSKEPLLTLMKQARAYGVGVVLATQNPVDLDYKGLSNAGTWFIGRLQTDQDKQRVLDGLQGAMSASGGGLDRRAADELLSQLASRVFLMKNIHEQAPVLFETRWALSYLRGPLTRNQIRSLTDTRRAAENTPPSTGDRQPIPAFERATAARAAASAPRPVLPPDIEQYFLPDTIPGAPITYRAALLGSARVYYSDAKAGLDQEIAVRALASILPGPVPVDWDYAQPTALGEGDLRTEPRPDAVFEALPPEAGKQRSYEAWKRQLVDSLFRNHRLELLRSDLLGLVSRPGESDRDFRLRVHQAARESRDEAAEKLRQKYAPRVAVLQDRLRKAEQAVAVQQDQARASTVSTAVSFGAALLSAFTGRKVASAGTIGRAATAARGASRSAKETADVARARENATEARARLEELESKFRAELNELAAAHGPEAESVEPFPIKPKKSNITARAVVLVWAPYTPGPDGRLTPAWPDGPVS